MVIIQVFLIVAHFHLKETIEKQVKKAINNNHEATVEWSALNLSLFKRFPDARVRLKDISVINKSPFEGDTLVSAQDVFLDMGITQLFKKGDHPLRVNDLGLDKAFVTLKVDKDGHASYDIAKAAD